MADELRYSISVTPVVENTATGSGETAHKSIDARAKRISNSDILTSGGGGVHNGEGSNAYVDGVIQCWSSGGEDGHDGFNTNGMDGVWIKNTGFKYDDTQTGNVDTSSPQPTSILLDRSSSVSSTYRFCKLRPGVSIFIPEPYHTSLSISDDEAGDPVAVEVVIYT